MSARPFYYRRARVPPSNEFFRCVVHGRLPGVTAYFGLVEIPRADSKKPGRRAPQTGEVFNAEFSSTRTVVTRKVYGHVVRRLRGENHSPFNKIGYFFGLTTPEGDYAPMTF